MKPIVLDPITVTESQQVPCGVSPLKKNPDDPNGPGIPDTDAVFAFTSENPDLVSVEATSSQSCIAHTPGEGEGTVNVVAKCAGYRDCVFPIKRVSSLVGEPNPSFGTPVEDSGD